VLNNKPKIRYIQKANCIIKPMKIQTAAITLFVSMTVTFTSCSLLHKGAMQTRNWKGSDLPGHNYATFDYLNGTQKFEVKVNKKSTFYFKYVTNIKAGKLHLSIESPTRVILSEDLRGAQTDSITVGNPAGETFQIVLVGSRAAGSFDFKYAEL
jgi:hypothetical protein